MEIITATTDFYIKEKTAVAIGKFDGIHIGHRRLLQEILKERECGLKACVFTFDPPPNVFFGKGNEKELTTRDEKRKLFENLGIDVLVEFPLTKATAATKPEDFVTDILHGKLHAKMVVAGTDLSFGAGGMGNAKLLEEMADALEMDVHIIDKIMLGEKEISSTLVRESVEKGDMPFVEKLLGVPYTVSGIVQHGNRIGRTLGMPTVNLLPDENKLLPPCGVYYSSALLQGKNYKAISNIGYKPTVCEKEKRLGVETYLYDYSGNAYGEEITVSLLEFKRDEQKFENLEALKAQMLVDINDGALYEK